MYDMQDNVVTRLSDDQMAGFDPVFSRDGKSVYFMSQTRENMRVYREMKSAFWMERQQPLWSKKARGMRSPVAIDGGLAVVSDKGSHCRFETKRRHLRLCARRGIGRCAQRR